MREWNRDERLHRWVWLTLAAGLAGCLMSIAAGLAWLGARGGAGVAAVPLGNIPASLKAGEPAALVSLGIALLLLTPIAALVVATVSFALNRERMALVSLAVVAILAASVLLGLV